MQFSAAAIAKLVGGTVEGDPQQMVSRPSTLESGESGTLAFLDHPKYEDQLYTTKASIVLIRRDHVLREPCTPTLIRVDEPRQALLLLLQETTRQQETPPQRAASAIVHESVILDESIDVADLAMICEKAVIGKACRIGAQSYIGPNVILGEDVEIGVGARVLQNCKIGNRCVIGPNAVIGSEGFGYQPTPEGTYQKIPHVGSVVLEDDVEIGANTTIDRGSLGDTIVRQGAKLDNLVHLAHNVEIGANTVIAAQVGVAGSTQIGASCRIGGQAGFAGHISIADGTQIQAQSGISSTLKKTGQALFGSPALPYQDFVRSHIVFKKLPEMYRTFNKMVKKVLPEE